MSPRHPIYPCHAAREKYTMGIARWWSDHMDIQLVSMKLLWNHGSFLLQCEKSSTINGFVSNSLLVVEMSRVSTRDNKMLFEWGHNMLRYIRTCSKTNTWPLSEMPKNCSGPWQESAITTISLTKQITVSRHGHDSWAKDKNLRAGPKLWALGQCEQHNVKCCSIKASYPQIPRRNSEKSTQPYSAMHQNCNVSWMFETNWDAQVLQLLPFHSAFFAAQRASPFRRLGKGSKRALDWYYPDRTTHPPIYSYMQKWYWFLPVLYTP